jgi:hypothetical protein
MGFLAMLGLPAHNKSGIGRMTHDASPKQDLLQYSGVYSAH